MARIEAGIVFWWLGGLRRGDVLLFGLSCLRHATRSLVKMDLSHETKSKYVLLIS